MLSQETLAEIIRRIVEVAQPEAKALLIYQAKKLGKGDPA